MLDPGLRIATFTRELRPIRGVPMSWTIPELPGAAGWHRFGALAAVGAAFGVDALVGEAQPLDGPAAHQVLLDNRRRVLRLDRAVPHRFGIHHDGRPVFALIQAKGFVDANAVGKTGGFGQLLQLGVQFAFAVGGA